MSLDNKIKTKIDNVIKSPMNDIYYSDFSKLINKTEYKMDDVLEYLIQKLKQELPKKKEIITVRKIMFSINLITEFSKKYQEILSEETIKKAYNTIIENKQIQESNILAKDAKTLSQILQKNYSHVEYKTNDEDKNHLKAVRYVTTLLETQAENKDLQIKLEKQGKKYSDLKQQKIALNELKDNLETKLSKVEKINSEQTIELKELKELVENLTVQNKELSENLDLSQKILNELQAEKKEQEETINKKNTIKNIILNELYKEERINIDGILSKLKQQKIATTKQEIHDCLIELKQNINIEGPYLNSINPYYKIGQPKTNFISPFHYKIEDYNQDLSVLIISDLHINYKSTLEELQNLNNIIYDYCEKNRIKLMFNLGDTFQIKYYNDNIDSKALKYLKELIDKFVDSVPANTDVYQLILGGNHDRGFLKFGLDPLQVIANKRDDLIPLGYDYRVIELGNKNNKILLHHPNRRFEEDEFFNFEMQSYLTNIYNEIDDKNNIYCNLIGHTHKSKIDAINNYCTIPSYTEDRIKNGCWRMDIHFDSNKHIDYIIFIPLIVENNTLTPITEITYQKIKTKRSTKNVGI